MDIISGAAEILSELDISLYLFISLLSTVLPIAIRVVVYPVVGRNKAQQHSTVWTADDCLPISVMLLVESLV